MPNTMTPFIPETAPFNPEQRNWLNGFFAGLFANNQESDGPDTPTKMVHIFYGSQTGTAETLAIQLKAKLSSKIVLCQQNSLADLSTDELKKIENLIIITSTYGDGEPPDNAKSFVQFLLQSKEPLTNLNYAICALGDTNYPKFCLCGKIIEQELKRLGAKKIIESVECDVDYEENFESFITNLQSKICTPEPSEIKDEKNKIELPKFSRKNPYPAQIQNKFSLANNNSDKDTWHIEIAIDPKEFPYEAGDALGVYPKNDLKVVQKICQAFKFDPNQQILTFQKTIKSISEALQVDYNIQQITDSLYKALLKKASPDLEDEQLEQKTLKINSLDLEDLAECMGLEGLNPQELITLLKPISPRLYSISSSPTAHNNSIHLTVGVLEYEVNNKVKKGVCSNYLKEASTQKMLPIYLHRNNAFKLPEPDKDIILIGPGTGIAPFRAFLQERSIKKATGKAWLFFGNPHKEKDFYYQEEIEAHFNDGVLHKLSTAFSRDQANKIYVQDKIREEKNQFYDWVKNGAYIFVCGDAKKMAKDVHETIKSLIAEFENISEIEAEKVLTDLTQSKRYLRDVY